MKLKLQKDLDPLKRRAIAEVDAGTPIDVLHTEKTLEAREILASADPDPADFPLLAAERGLTAPTLQEVAQVVLEKHLSAKREMAEKERLRLSRKKAIRDADNQYAIDDAKKITL